MMMKKLRQRLRSWLGVDQCDEEIEELEDALGAVWDKAEHAGQRIVDQQSAMQDRKIQQLNGRIAEVSSELTKRIGSIACETKMIGQSKLRETFIEWREEHHARICAMEGKVKALDAKFDALLEALKPQTFDERMQAFKEAYEALGEFM